jgi:hypothetical protein
MIEYITECKYVGITGMVYTPYVMDGKWYVIPNNPVSFLHFVYLCNVPEEEAIILKLKYGSKISADTDLQVR